MVERHRAGLRNRCASRSSRTRRHWAKSPTGSLDHRFGKQVRVQSDTKLQTDVVASAHAAPVTMLPCDWTTTVDALKMKNGESLPENVLPAQPYFEAFEGRFVDGMMRAESRAQVVSMAEEQDDMMPDTTGLYGISFDSRLAVTAKRRHFEEPRWKDAVLSNLWFLAQMRQPRRHMYTYLDKLTHTKGMGISSVVRLGPAGCHGKLSSQPASYARKSMFFEVKGPGRDNISQSCTKSMPTGSSSTTNHGLQSLLCFPEPHVRRPKLRPRTLLRRLRYSWQSLRRA